MVARGSRRLRVASSGGPCRELTAPDLLWVGWRISLSIGLAVLYRQRTGSIATMLLALSGVAALLIAAVRAS